MIMFLIDGASWALDQTVFPGDVMIQNIVNVVLYLMGPITAIFWLFHPYFWSFHGVLTL